MSIKFFPTLLVAFFAIFSKGWSTESSPQKIVEVIRLQKTSIREGVRLFGRVRAKLEYTHVAETDGVLGHALLAGQALKKGQIFASLDNPEVKATYGLAKKSEDIALEQYQRSQTLLSKRAVSQKKAESDRAQWIEAKQRSLQAKVAFDKTQFKAPFDGVLGVFKKRKGAYLQKGDLVVTLYNPESLVVEVDIPEKYVRTLSSQSQVLIEGNSYTLTQLQKVVDPATNMAPSFVDLGHSVQLIPGSIVDVDLVLKEKAEALVIPKDSLFIEGVHHYVYAIKNGKTVKKEVILGLSEGDTIEVQKGLQEGDQIVFKNPSRLLPDEAVSLFSEATHSKTDSRPSQKTESS